MRGILVFLVGIFCFSGVAYSATNDPYIDSDYLIDIGTDPNAFTLGVYSEIWLGQTFTVQSPGILYSLETQFMQGAGTDWDTKAASFYLIGVNPDGTPNWDDNFWSWSIAAVAIPTYAEATTGSTITLDIPDFLDLQVSKGDRFALVAGSELGRYGWPIILSNGGFGPDNYSINPFGESYIYFLEGPYAGSWLVDREGSDHDCSIHVMMIKGVPEPATWLFMILGFLFLGVTIRRSVHA